MDHQSVVTLLRQVAHYKAQIEKLQQLAQHSQQTAELHHVLQWADRQQRGTAAARAIAQHTLTRYLASIGRSPVLNAMLLAAPLGKKAFESLGGEWPAWSEHKALRMSGDAVMIAADLACAAALLADDVTLIGILTDVGLIPIAHDVHKRSRRLGRDILETAAEVQPQRLWRHIRRTVRTRGRGAAGAQANPETASPAPPALLPNLSPADDQPLT
jgi:hypothetical protein